MTRETKATFIQINTNSCRIQLAGREDNGRWQSQGTVPMAGTLEQVKAEWVANQERWGWTLYDTESADIMTFWKEF